MNAPLQTPRLSPQSTGTGRKVVFRTHGHAQGRVTRMVSPSDLGRLIAPFVFLDLFEDTVIPEDMPQNGWHPHSGIATLTLLMEGELHFIESLGHEGLMVAGDIEWMCAGRGVWHTGGPGPHRTPATGFQLWVALPADRELLPAYSHRLPVADVPADGPARILLGRSGEAVSPIDAPDGINYFDVQLKAGERWTYQPPQGYLVGWVAVMHGSVRTPETIGKGELAVFNPSDAVIEFEATADTRFVLGTAIPHPHDLHLGYYSVHTSSEALIEGEREIQRIGQDLRAKGALR